MTPKIEEEKHPKLLFFGIIGIIYFVGFIVAFMTGKSYLPYFYLTSVIITVAIIGTIFGTIFLENRKNNPEKEKFEEATHEINEIYRELLYCTNLDELEEEYWERSFKIDSVEKGIAYCQAINIIRLFGKTRKEIESRFDDI